MGWDPGDYFQKHPRRSDAHPHFEKQTFGRWWLLGGAAGSSTPSVGRMAISMTQCKETGLLLAEDWMRPRDLYVGGFKIRGAFRLPTASLLSIIKDRGHEAKACAVHAGNLESQVPPAALGLCEHRPACISRFSSPCRTPWCTNCNC